MTKFLDLSGAAFTVTWRSIGTHQILAVFPDRTVWYWAMATIGPRSCDVGSYRMEASAVQYAAVERLEARLGDAAPPADELGMTVAFGQRSVWVSDGTDRSGAVAAAVLPLVELAIAKPVAAARFGAQVVMAPTGQMVAGFTFASLGVEPVQLRFEAESFELSSSSGEALALPAPRMGLVDSAGTLLDGLYQIATVPVGGQGSCTVVLANPPGPPPAGAGIVGVILLAGPWSALALPAADFEASCAIPARKPS